MKLYSNFLKIFQYFFGFFGLIISIIHFTVSQIIHKYVYNYCTCNGNIMNPQFIVYHVYPSIFSGLLISSKCQPWLPKIVDFWIYQAHYPYSIVCTVWFRCYFTPLAADKKLAVLPFTRCYTRTLYIVQSVLLVSDGVFGIRI